MKTKKKPPIVPDTEWIIKGKSALDNPFDTGCEWGVFLSSFFRFFFFLFQVFSKKLRGDVLRILCQKRVVFKKNSVKEFQALVVVLHMPSSFPLIRAMSKVRGSAGAQVGSRILLAL